jgi:hypothetical protein
VAGAVEPGHATERRIGAELNGESLGRRRGDACRLASSRRRRDYREGLTQPMKPARTKLAAHRARRGARGSLASRSGCRVRHRLLQTSDQIPYRAVTATSVERLAEQAPKLPSEARARLADLLVESLDDDELGRIDRLWTAEAKRRRDEVRASRVKTVPGDQARRKVRAAVRR